MIRFIGIAFSAFELLGFGILVWLAHRSQQNFGWLFLAYTALTFSVFGFVLRLREQSLAAELAEAEEKLVKRVLRRLAKQLPDMFDEHFGCVKGGYDTRVATPVACLDAVYARIVESSVLSDAVTLEVNKQIAGEALGALVQKHVTDLFSKTAKEA